MKQILFFIALIFVCVKAAELSCNINSVSPYSPSVPFTNVVKQGTLVNITGLATFAPSSLDANGWPLADFVLVVFQSAIYVDYQDPYSISGTYNLNYVGPACTISGYTADTNVSKVSCNGTNCAATVSFYGNQLMIKFTGTQGKVKNVTLVKSGKNPSNLFDADFLATLAPFPGLLRLMPWENAANNPLTTWAGRSLPTDAVWSSSLGVPYEIQIALGNALNKDIWINTPIGVDVQFLQELAILVKANLNSNLNVYLENANEVWNGEFQSYQVNSAAAVAEVAAWPKSPLNFDNCTITTAGYCKGIWSQRRHALRTYNTSLAFAAVWGQAAINTRVRVMLPGQGDYPTSTAWGLNMINTLYGPPSKFLYGCAGGGYLNLGQLNNYDNMTTDSVLAAFNTSLITYSTENAFSNWFVLTRNYSLHYIAYEGGLDTFGPNGIDAKRTASLDPRIGAIMDNMLNQWFAWGFNNFNWFMCDSSGANWITAFGTWGLILTPQNRTTAKWEAAVAYVKTSPPLTAGYSTNTLVDARLYSGAYLPLNNPWWMRSYGHTGNFSYPINCPVGGVYTISISFANITGNYSVQAYVVDTKSKGVIPVVKTNDTAFVFSKPVNITFNTGINLLQLGITNDNSFAMQYFKFTLQTPQAPVKTPMPSLKPTPPPTSTPTTHPTPVSIA